jgi:hypothetical protein
MAAFKQALAEAAALDGGGAFRLPVAHCSTSARDLDATDAASWAREGGFAGERMRWYLEYAARDDYGCRLEQTSAWALVHYFVSRLARGTGSEAEFMTWPEGNQFLVDRLRAGIGERIRTRHAALRLSPTTEGVSVDVLDAESETVFTIMAEHAILAVPQYVARRLLAADPHADNRRRFRYAPWVVANLHLERRPVSRGFEQAWDNVLYESDSLGYVDAGHQVDSASGETVWTWYLPVVDRDEPAARAVMLEAPWERWRDLVMADLRRAHPDIEECVTRIDVHRWGHGMVKPLPGFLWDGDRERAARPLGRIHFAHSDLGGLPLFEEAHWAGCRAAEEILSARGVAHESLL